MLVYHRVVVFCELDDPYALAMRPSMRSNSPRSLSSSMPASAGTPLFQWPLAAEWVSPQEGHGIGDELDELDGVTSRYSGRMN